MTSKRKEQDRKEEGTRQRRAPAGSGAKERNKTEKKKARVRDARQQVVV